MYLHRVLELFQKKKEAQIVWILVVVVVVVDEPDVLFQILVC
jgi:hypothetical protein